MATSEAPAADREFVQPDGWPEVVKWKAFYGQEDDHWYAIEVTFDIATMADSEEAVLLSVKELLCDYLNSCYRDGMRFEEVVRPVPLRTSIKLQAKVIANKPLKWLRRSKQVGARESDMPLPGILSYC